jgi:hypothetical protein
MARAAYESSQPYEQYGGQRLAYFSPGEQQAMSQYQNMAMAGTPAELDSAGQTAHQVSQGYNTAFTGPQYQAGQHSGGYAGAGQAAGGYGGDSISSQYDPNSREMGYQAGQLGDFDRLNNQEAIQSYSDPYMQQVVDVQKREAARQQDMRHAQTGLDAAGMGSLGGYREAIMRSEGERNLGQLMDDQQVQGSQAAFDRARQAMVQDRASEEGRFGMNEAMRQAQEQFGQSQFGMNEQAQQAAEQYRQGAFGLTSQAQAEAGRQAQNASALNMQDAQFGAQHGLNSFLANEQARQQQAQFGLDQYGLTQQAQNMMGNQRLQGAGMLGDYVQQRQNMEYERLGMMDDAGQRQRGLHQASLDMGYQDFLRQQGYGQEQAGWLMNMLQGTPITPGSTQTIYGQPSNSFGDLLGAGIGAAGLYNQTRP